MKKTLTKEEYLQKLDELNSQYIEHDIHELQATYIQGMGGLIQKTLNAELDAKLGYEKHERTNLKKIILEMAHIRNH